MSRAWDKEKNKSPTGFELMTSQTPGGRSDYRKIPKISLSKYKPPKPVPQKTLR